MPVQICSTAKYRQNPWTFGNWMNRGTINNLLRKLKRLSQNMHFYRLPTHFYMEVSKWSAPISPSFISEAAHPRTPLVAQWLRIRLPVQGTRVRALVQQDPTCRRATKPVHHNYWACALEPASHNYWAHVPQLLKPVRLEPMLHNKRSRRTATNSSPRSLQLEKAHAQQRRPNTAKNK